MVLNLLPGNRTSLWFVISTFGSFIPSTVYYCFYYYIAKDALMFLLNKYAARLYQPAYKVTELSNHHQEIDRDSNDNIFQYDNSTMRFIKYFAYRND